MALWQAPTVQMDAALTDPGAPIYGTWMTNLGAAGTYFSMRTDEAMANLARHNINTLYPCVWSRGLTLHPSEVAKAAGAKAQDPLTTFPLWKKDDVLQALINQGERQQIRVVPWFEYGLMIPTSSAIAQAHPDWLTQTAEGKTVANPLTPAAILPKPLQNLQLELAGGNLAWLNPAHPDVQQLLTDLIVEVVERYPIAGIQLDDHFGLPVAFGYDDYTASLYADDHGGSPPPADSRDPEWVRWRASHISNLMAKISQAVKAARPEATVSLSPNPPRFAYDNYLQD